MAQPPQQIVCPNCFTPVTVGSRFCPRCGNAIPPPVVWPTPSAPASTSRRNVALIVVAAVLIVLLVGGVAGYLFYQNNQQQILQTAKASEANAANQAPNQLQNTCFSNRTDSSSLYGQYPYYSGQITVYETIGVHNPTNFKIDATWTITLDYPRASWVLSNAQSFHLPPDGTAYPTFAFVVTGNQLDNTPSNADLSVYTITQDGSYTVTGTYATYNPTTHSTYDSTTNSGSGSSGSGSNLPKC